MRQENSNIPRQKYLKFFLQKNIFWKIPKNLKFNILNNINEENSKSINK